MYLIIADVHQGLSRKTGVTPDSLTRFEQDKITDLNLLLKRNKDKEVIIAGDLFDSYRVPLHSVLQISEALLRHPQKVWVIAGNHDLSKDTAKMSSLLFFSRWIDLHATNITIVFKPTMLDNQVLMLPHMPNQTLFDAEIEKANAEVLITHCNFENNFTTGKDHSLNLTRAQAKKFKLVLSGHEHNARKVGNVFMLGSFAPCNVGEAAHRKQSYIFSPEDLSCTAFDMFEQEEHNSYASIHWKELDVAPDVGFLKVIGDASAAEAPTVLSAVAAYRKTASCYMVQNAVIVESIELSSIEGASFESVDTWGLLSNILSDDHKTHLKELGYVID